MTILSAVFGRAIFGNILFGYAPPAPIIPFFPTPNSRTFSVSSCFRGTAQAVKTHNEIVDFAINWSAILDAGEEIETSVWNVEGDLILTAPAPYIQANNTATTVWLSEGTTGLNYSVTNTIMTTGGREFEASFNCLVEQYRPIDGGC